MAFIPLTKRFTLKAATFSIAEDEYSDAVSRVEFTPTTRSSTWSSINSNSISDQSPATWTCTLGFAQDLAPEGLMRYLLDHEGEDKICTFVPVDDGPQILATLSISPARFGGQSDGNIVTGEVTMGVVGRPEFVDPSES